MMKKILAAAAIAASLGSVALPAAADVVLRIGPPPPPRVERVPPPRHGYVWVPGHWDWNGHRHVWVGGTWLRERTGYRYVEPTWVEDGGRWRVEHGRWERAERDREHDRGYGNGSPRGDRDHDGVPNRYDEHPDNPNRR